MKKTWLVIGILIMWINALSTDRYFTTGGSDATGTGTIGNPYASLGKAASVAVAGDVIKAGAGTFTQITQVIIAPSVSLEGQGAWAGGTRINLSYTVAGSGGYNQAAIQLVTASVNSTIGNQTISGIWFDGTNFSCYNGILVRCRSNVIFSYCKFTSFGIVAIAFNGKSSNVTGTPPATFSQGNKVINSSFYDCNDRLIQAANSISAGSISYSGQRNLLFQYDTLINTGKAQGHNGNLFGAVQGNNIGIKWLNCIMTKPANEGTSFNFSIESWYDQGGCEVAYNTFTGAGNHIDIGYGGANKGDSVYSWYIHHNTFTNPALLTASPGTQPVLSIAVQFESSTNISFGGLRPTDGDAIIEYNYCKNMGTLVQIGLANYSGDFIDNIYINHNVVENGGYANNTYSSILQFGLTNGVRINNVFVDNNTLVSNTGVGNSKAIMILHSDVGVISNIYFRNNIAMNSNGYGYMVFRGSNAANNIFSQNNIVFQNAFTNNPFIFPGTPAPTNFTFTNLAADKVNPQFVSAVPVIDYHLATGSPAITGGLIPPSSYRGAYPVTPSNIAPVANAGTNKNITLPTNSVSQSGSGTDADGTITAYLWTKISGPATYTIVSPGAATTTINNLVAGVYVFQLTVTDNGGLTGTDQTTIVVNAAPPANVPPIANAGGNKSIQLPVSTVTQTGTGTDSDGTIASYLWTKTSGPATYNIVSPTSATTVINGLTTAGVYVFTLTVTDNLGLTGSSTATITVNPAVNVAPTADAGVNQTLTWPTNFTTLSGSGIDTDGTVTGYSWARVSGGAATITSSGQASTTITGLAVGVYVFRLTVIDNSGGTGTDDIQVTVNKGSATISFNAPSLTTVFNNLPQSPTVVTSPAGLSYSITLAGTTGGKTNAGSYPAIAGITDPNWTFTPANGTFTITKAIVVINASDSTLNYDGAQHTILATTTPSVPGLSQTCDASATPCSAIGVHDIDIILTNANYQASPVSVTLTIVSNAASIFISNIAQTYTGFTLPVTVTTNPSGLPVSVTYNLSGTAPINAGTYNVIATITSGGTGADTATLVIAKRQGVFTWPQPLAIPYGTTLSTVQLNASADISGTWSYSYPIGAVLPIGVTSVTATFTPTDPANFSGGSISVPIHVFAVNPFLNYFISGNGKYFFVEL